MRAVAAAARAAMLRGAAVLAVAAVLAAAAGTMRATTGCSWSAMDSLKADGISGWGAD